MALSGLSEWTVGTIICSTEVMTPIEKVIWRTIGRGQDGAQDNGYIAATKSGTRTEAFSWRSRVILAAIPVYCDAT